MFKQLPNRAVIASPTGAWRSTAHGFRTILRLLRFTRNDGSLQGGVTRRGEATRRGGGEFVLNQCFPKLIFFILCGVLSLGAQAADVKALLKQADSYRLPDAQMQVETEVQLFKNGKLDKERSYTVYVKPGRRSLVLMQSPAEKGQKVLMLGDDFWQIMPQSQRPIRITPLQKLLGDASAGDIATMSWSEDYDGKIVGETRVGDIPCLRLDLTATRKGVSYQRVELYLSKAGAHPVKADLYVASDKLAKQALFTVEQVDGRPQVSAMRLIDQIQTNRETVIRYLSRKARTIPDEYYNPMFLTRSDLKE